MSQGDARFTLSPGEGDGAILGLAAGDSAGGVWKLGYSAHTQQAVVIAYDLIEHGRPEVDRITSAIRELDGVSEETPVYRAESPEFRAWLDRAGAGGVEPGRIPSLDHASRSVPLGVANRLDLSKLTAEVLELGRTFHSDATSLLVGATFGAAVAASCYGQSGKDFLAGIAEALDTMSGEIAAAASTDSGVVDDAAEEIRDMIPLVGITEGEAALAGIGASKEASVWELTKASLLVCAPPAERDHLPIEQAARIGGSALGAAVGGIMGARAGIRAWPWAFANDTWFAEIGRRLVRGPAEVMGLPIPYAVEHHLMSGERQGFR